MYLFSAKSWGDPSKKTALVLHGRLDNAGSFDDFIPLLPDSFYYICLDLPGHGKSSHFPEYVLLNVFNFVIAIKLTADYLKQEKYVLISHSFGAAVSMLFSRLYPQYVEKIVSIDPLIAPISADKFDQYLRKVFDENMDIEKKQATMKKPSYSEEEIIERVRNARWGEAISADAAKNMVDRSKVPAGKFSQNN